MKVCMFVKNSFEYDARVTKEAKSLIGAGHDVTVIAIHVPEVTAAEETTTDGIHVVRVSRMSFGLGTLNRIAARYAGTIEERHARLTGEEVDQSRMRELATLHPPSTATPGDAVEVTVPVTTAAPPPTPSRRLWARLTTPALRGLAQLARFGFRVVKALVGRQGRALKTWAINRRMIAAGLATGADVFHSHDLNTLYVGHVCKSKTGGRLVYDSHELATERNRMGFWWRAWATWNERQWLPSADALIVASPSWEGYLRDKYRAVPSLAATVINVPERIEIESGWDLHERLGIPPASPILLYQGSIQENRGIEPAIEALTRLDQAVLVVIGYGYHRTALEAMVRRQRLEERVKFFGPIPNHELLFYTASADIGMCNIVNSSLSYYTSLPNKLFEYLMAGIPVIGSDSPEIGRVVRETGAGEVADPVDPDALAAAATAILADSDRYRAAARRAVDTYNWEVEQQKLLHLYRQLTV